MDTDTIVFVQDSYALYRKVAFPCHCPITIKFVVLLPARKRGSRHVGSFSRFFFLERQHKFTDATVRVTSREVRKLGSRTRFGLTFANKQKQI